MLSPKSQTALVYDLIREMIKIFRTYILLCLVLSSYGQLLSGQNWQDTTVYIRAIGGLQFDQVRFQVKPGQKVKIVLENIDDMAHNLLVVQPKSRIKVIDAALKLKGEGPKRNYTPDVEEVLWAIPVLEPNESGSVTFIAPEKTGVYPYVCTLPGHGSMMFGAMYVTLGGIPLLAEDPNIPALRRIDEESASTKSSVRQNEGPALYRIFMPDASPASIAVKLTEKLSYCWDAGECRLRYAWSGGFIDNTDIWKGHHDAYAEIIGNIFFRDETLFPLCMDFPENQPMTEFKGYRLIQQMPEFHYRIDGADVYEWIEPGDQEMELVRTFRIPDAKRNIWFVRDPEDGIKYEASTGEWVNGNLKIRSEEAKSFTIRMKK